MVAAFEARADPAALQVVATWKLSGRAAEVRAAVLREMKALRPDVYERVLGPDFVPPTVSGESPAPQKQP